MSEKETVILTSKLKDGIWNFLDNLGYVNICDEVCVKIDELADIIIATMIEENNNMDHFGDVQ